MNEQTNYARRYHWLSEHFEDFLCEPHNSIIGEKQSEKVLDMTSKKSISTQKISVDLVNENPRHLKRDWAILSKPHNQKTLDKWMMTEEFNSQIESLLMPRNINWCKIKQIYDFQPKNYEELISMRGVGPNTVRALALISDLIYGEKPSWKDPVKYSFTVGGKDGVPFPVEKNVMDESTEIIQQGIQQAKIGNKDKLQVLRRLQNFVLPS
jgi:hypothetical protein